MTDESSASRDRVERKYRERTPTSLARHHEALQYLPGGDTRNSTYHLPYPLYVDWGAGRHLWDRSYAAMMLLIVEQQPTVIRSRSPGGSRRPSRLSGRRGSRSIPRFVVRRPSSRWR